MAVTSASRKGLVADMTGVELVITPATIPFDQALAEVVVQD